MWTQALWSGFHTDVSLPFQWQKPRANSSPHKDRRWIHNEESLPLASMVVSRRNRAWRFRAAPCRWEWDWERQFPGPLLLLSRPRISREQRSPEGARGGHPLRSQPGCSPAHFSAGGRGQTLGPGLALPRRDTGLTPVPALTAGPGGLAAASAGTETVAPRLLPP